MLCLARVKEKKTTTTKNIGGGGGGQRRESFATKRRSFISIPRREQDWNTTREESSLVPSFDLRDADYSVVVVDVNDDTQTTTTT